jgi:ketosteroid isomerase-like protein
MISEEQKTVVLNAVKKASKDWQTAFNSGDFEGCVAQYEANAVMNVNPFGQFSGTDQIRAFWQKLIDEGFSDVEYIDTQIEVINETRAELKAGWKMNKAHGVIHRELWVLQEDGSAKLREDNFEALA